MTTHTKYSTPIVRFGLIALATCALAGCWEEIEYTPPPATSQSPPDAASDSPPITKNELTMVEPPTEPAADSSATNFADDFANAFEPNPPAAVPTTSSPAGETASGSNELSRATKGGETPRYAETSPAAQEIPHVEPPRYVPSVVEQDGPMAITPETPTPEPEPDHVEPAQPSIQPITNPEPASATSQPPATTRPPANTAANTRRVAWLLGAKLSLAAQAHERGATSADVKKWFAQSQTLARLLGTTVDPLPPTASAGLASGSNYMLTQGQRIGRDLSTRYGEDHAALFELAAKSNILISLYQPRSLESNALAEAIARAGQRAGLPAALFEPLVKAVRLGQPPATIREAILQLNRALDQQLNAPVSTPELPR